jgi:hypothetical protein
MIELILSILLSIFSIFSKSKIILIISLPTTIYNLYSYYKKTYILKYEIAAPKENQKIYYQESLKYKIKFGIYISITTVSIIIFIIRFILFIIEYIFNDKERTEKVLNYFGIFKTIFG